jgi:hypothetical protein
MTPTTLLKDEDMNTSNEKPMNKKSLQSYLAKILKNSSWYFNFKATKHVIGNKTC